MDWLQMLFNNPGTGLPIAIVCIVIGIPIVGSMFVALVSVFAKHRERMAMIEQGMHPDHPPDEPSQDDNALPDDDS